MVPIVKYTFPIINEIQMQVKLTYAQAIKDHHCLDGC